jgi:ubiquinone/menaquinone biosynthesis C-methylase UbiE
MELGEKYKDLYGDYYSEDGGSALSVKRQVTSDATAAHFASFFSNPKFDKLIDIGAGDGSTIVSLSKLNMADEYTAMEVSQSGVDQIRSKNIKKLHKIELFDGYNIPAAVDSYDVGVAAHVLEHVEHERLFLKEFARVSKLCFLEVPLEHTLNVSKAIRVGYKAGHINFYNVDTILSLVKSSELQVIKHQVFQHPYSYEKLVSGHWKGPIKYMIKKLALIVSPKLATTMFAYTAGVLFCTQLNYDQLKSKV